MHLWHGGRDLAFVFLTFIYRFLHCSLREVKESPLLSPDVQSTHAGDARAMWHLSISLKKKVATSVIFSCTTLL